MTEPVDSHVVVVGRGIVPVEDDWSVAVAGGWPPEAVARCGGCGLGYVIDEIRYLLERPADGETEPVVTCGDCGSPVYLVDPDDVDEESAGAVAYELAGAGWDRADDQEGGL